MSELEFFPIDDEFPDWGETISFAVPNPDYDDEIDRYIDALEDSPRAEDEAVMTFAPGLAHRPDDLVDADKLCTDVKAATLVVGYPSPRQFGVTVRPAGDRFTRGELFGHIQRVFAAVHAGATGLDTTADAWRPVDDLVVAGIVVQRFKDGRVYFWIALE